MTPSPAGQRCHWDCSLARGGGNVIPDLAGRRR